MNISSPDGSSHNQIFLSIAGLEINSAFLSAVQIITIVFGLPTNSYVIWLIMSGTGNGLTTEFFTLNLSICEMIFCAECILAVFVHLCKVLVTIVNFIDGLVVTGRALFQSLICVERYLAVIHPVTFLKFKPLRYRVICSVIVWMTGCITCGVNIMAAFWQLSGLFFGFVFTQFLLFFSIHLFCLVAVLRALKQSGPGEGRREEENHMKRRAFHLILITTVTMLVLYVPYITFIVPQWVSAKYAVILLSVSYIFFSSAGLVQPFLFLYRVGKLPFVKCQ